MGTLLSSRVGEHFQLPILGRLSPKRHRKALQVLAAGHEHSDVLARATVRQACMYRKIKGPFSPPARATLSPPLRHWKPPPSCSAVRAPREAAWQAARRPLRAPRRRRRVTGADRAQARLVQTSGTGCCKGAEG